MSYYDDYKYLITDGSYEAQFKLENIYEKMVQ